MRSKRGYQRTDRIADQMQRELSDLIFRELKDPRVGMVTVTAIEVSRELDHAKVFFTVMPTVNADPAKSREALQRAAGFLRHELGLRMQMRTIPALHFAYDESLQRGNAMSALIDQALAKDRAGHDDEPEA